MATSDEQGIEPAQSTGLEDMDPASFRAAGHVVVDLMADYLAGVERYPVFPPIEPGSPDSAVP